MTTNSDEWTVASSKKRIFKQIAEPIANTIINNLPFISIFFNYKTNIDKL